MAHVRVDALCEVESGIPQGSILRPILWWPVRASLLPNGLTPSSFFFFLIEKSSGVTRKPRHNLFKKLWRG